MNPFDFSGPEFLLFYALLTAVALLAQRYWRLSRESREVTQSPPRLTDPYEIAYLRGGPNELTRVAVISLIQRKALTVIKNDSLIADPEFAPPSHPLEDLIFKFFRAQHKGYEVLKDSWVSIREKELYQEGLVSKGLLLAPDQISRRRLDAAIVAAGLVLVSATKIAIALSRGHHNIGILIVCTLFAAAGCFAVANGRQSPLGVETIKGLTELFDKRFATNATSVEQVVLVAAVCGLPAYAAIGYPYAKKLFPQAGSSSTCGSSCGSSGSSGSSCGGGGSGCGGCGGS